MFLISESLQNKSSRCCPNLGHCKRKWDSSPISSVSEFLQMRNCLGFIGRLCPPLSTSHRMLSSDASSLMLSTTGTKDTSSWYNIGCAIIHISGCLAECGIPCFNGVFIYVAQLRVPLIVVPPHVMPQMQCIRVRPVKDAGSKQILHHVYTRTEETIRYYMYTKVAFP